MRAFFFCLLLLCQAGAAPLSLFGGESFTSGDSRLGMNLSGPEDWNSELPFVDVFRLSRSWFSQQHGRDWNQGPALDLDEHGWVKSLAPGCFVETVMCTDIPGGNYPAGNYVCLYDGEGTVDFWNIERVVSRSPGRIVFEAAPERGAIFLRISATNPGNYVRNIRVIMPGFENRYRVEPFHPLFLARWRQMRVMRFMDWMDTNNSKIYGWADRPRVEDSTWTVKGVPLEVMIDLSNRLGIDPWFCMPHGATDEYVREFAEQVARELDQARKVYVEYSNEIWNFVFEQTHYAGQEGKKLNLHEKEWEAGWRYGSMRSVEIFRIWRKAFGGTKRLVRVMASQAANPYISETKLAFQGAYKECDALAIAPYMSLNVSPDSNPSAGEVARWSVDRVLDYLEKTSLPEAIGWMKSSKAVADKYGVELLAYEAGQHAVGIQGGENIEELTKVFFAANRHPRMGGLYTKYLNAWLDSGGGVCVLFSSVNAWSKWGAWGLLEHYYDDTPKYRAVLDWNLSHPMRKP